MSVWSDLLYCWMSVYTTIMILTSLISSEIRFVYCMCELFICVFTLTGKGL